jgi:hypothetical protein
MVRPLEETFPGLAGCDHRVTSPPSRRYNCIAWAAGDTANWWWPIPGVNEVFWPAEVPRTEELAAFRYAFATLGYSVCDSDALEPGFEKVALFANEQGVPLHAAGQLPSARWTSKLGELEDIEHALRDLEGIEYGKVVLVLKRPATHLTS